MRATLSLACLAAAAQAIELTNDMPSYGHLAAQVGAHHFDSCCCHISPCMPTCSAPCEENPDDVSKGLYGREPIEEAVDTVSPTTDVIIEHSGIVESITPIVGEDEAGTIIEDVVTPIIDTAIIESGVLDDEIEDALDDQGESGQITFSNDNEFQDAQLVPSLDDIDLSDAVGVIVEDVLPNVPHCGVDYMDDDITIEVYNDEGDEGQIEITLEDDEFPYCTFGDEVDNPEPFEVTFHDPETGEETIVQFEDLEDYYDYLDTQGINDDGSVVSDPLIPDPVVPGEEEVADVEPEGSADHSLTTDGLIPESGQEQLQLVIDGLQEHVNDHLEAQGLNDTSEIIENADADTETDEQPLLTDEDTEATPTISEQGLQAAQTGSSYIA